MKSKNIFSGFLTSDNTSGKFNLPIQTLQITNKKSLQNEEREQNNNQNETVTQEERSLYFSTLCVLSVCLACISCGIFLGYTSSAIPSMQGDESMYHKEDDWLRQLHNMLIGGLGPFGAIFGSLISALPIRYFGPRRTIAFLGIPLLFASWITIGFASGIMTILVGRLIGGIGVGSTIASAPLYVIDISNVENRGRNGVLPQLLMIFGIFLSYALGSFLNWSNLSLASSIIVLVAAGILPFSPDSPKWLVAQGKVEKCLTVLKRIHGERQGQIKFEELTAIKDIADVGTKKDWNVRQILTCLGLISIQQLSGVNGITFFAASIFSAGETPSSGHLPSIILAVTQLVASFSSTFFIERFGRTLLLKISTTTITISGSILGSYFYFLGETHSETLKWIPLLSLILFAFGFAIGLGPVTWILVAEILPQEVRNVLNPVILAYNWLCVCIVTTSFPWLRESINYYGIFWGYAGVAFIGLWFVILFVPETKGKNCT